MPAPPKPARHLDRHRGFQWLRSVKLPSPLLKEAANRGGLQSRDFLRSFLMTSHRPYGYSSSTIGKA